MSIKLLTEHHLEFISLKGDCTGSSESTHVKTPHCWKSYAAAHMKLTLYRQETPKWVLLQTEDPDEMPHKEVFHQGFTLCYDKLVLQRNNYNII